MITGDTPAAAVCVRPGEDGSVFAFADSQVAPDDLLAVTVEPSIVLGRPDHAADLGRAGHVDVTVVPRAQPASISRSTICRMPP